jgi:DNA-binding NarL/FixJ family response regulator
MIDIFLADDHTIVREGLRVLLDGQPDMRVVGDAADGRHTLEQVQRLRPTVVLMDIAMPDLNGIEATRQIRTACPATHVVILSMHSTSEHVFQALEAGASGYLLKESAGVEVIEAVRAAAAGQRYLSHKIAATMDAYIQQREHATRSPLDRLSAREREILQLVVEGYSSADIAARLFLSPKTVETYRSRLMHKLDVRDIPTLVKFAIQHGLTPL